jgi:hypothetical protein
MNAFEETKRILATIEDRSGLRSSKYSRNNQGGLERRETNRRRKPKTEERSKYVSGLSNRQVPGYYSSAIRGGIRSAFSRPSRQIGARRSRKINQLVGRRDWNKPKEGNRRKTGLAFGMDPTGNNMYLNDTKKFGSMLSAYASRRPRGDVTINRRNEFNTPMPMVSPEASARNFKGEMGMVVRGSEFLTHLTVYTTSSTTIAPTAVADCIYSLPLSPLFMPGTRLTKFSEMYRKYKFSNVVLEFIPNAPSTQNGGFIGFVTHDPDENITIATSEDAKIREAMARKGAEIWNCMTYGRVHYTDDGTYGWYFTGDADNAESAIAGTMNILSDSTFLPFDGTQTSLTIGQIMLHYELHLCDRIYDNRDDDDAGEVLFNTGATVATDTYFSGLTSDDLVGSTSAEFAAMFGTTPRMYHIFQLKVLTPFLSGATPVTPSQINTSNGSHRFFGAGSIWWAFCVANGTDVNVYYTNKLSDALNRNATCTWALAPGANCQYCISIQKYTTDYDD